MTDKKYYKILKELTGLMSLSILDSERTVEPHLKLFKGNELYKFIKKFSNDDFLGDIPEILTIVCEIKRNIKFAEENNYDFKKSIYSVSCFIHSEGNFIGTKYFKVNNFTLIEQSKLRKIFKSNIKLNY